MVLKVVFWGLSIFTVLVVFCLIVGGIRLLYLLLTRNRNEDTMNAFSTKWNEIAPAFAQLLSYIPLIVVFWLIYFKFLQ